MQFKEIILETTSLKRTRLFYHKTLELDILSEGDESISFKAGKTTLTFKEGQSEKPFYHFAFNITNNKFSDSYEWIDNKLDILPGPDGLPIVAYNDWNAQSFYFYDNNGNILEFIVRFDLPYYSKEAFSANHIEEISEIGLVVPDVAVAAEKLHKENKIPYFVYGPRLTDFITMGDNHGIILLSTPNRKWVPVNKLATPYPVTIITDDDNIISL